MPLTQLDVTNINTHSYLTPARREGGKNRGVGGVGQKKRDVKKGENKGIGEETQRENQRKSE